MAASRIAPGRALLAAAVVLFALPASGQDAEPAHAEERAFDSPWALAVYGTSWSGEYSALGLGGRARFEFSESAGLEVFAEMLDADWPGADRRDYPVGFYLYVPFDLTSSLRLRPMAGMCAMFSFVGGGTDGAPEAQDILFGLDAGAGLEWAPWSAVSLFVEARGIVYWGHGRDVQSWTSDIGERLEETGHFQVSAGLQVHL